MTLPHLLFVLNVQWRETLRQARRAGIAWALLGVTVVAALFCLSVSVADEPARLPITPHDRVEFLPAAEAAKLGRTPADARSDGVDVPGGELRLLFGAVRVPLWRTGDDAVRLVYLILAGGVAGTAGLLLALVWTAGFLPGFLSPSTLPVTLAKPLPRGLLLTAKAAGIAAVVAGFAALFTGATWLALGLATGLWEATYLAALPLLVIHFGIFLGVSALIAVWTRSPAACALGTVIVWLGCFAVNVARHDAVLHGSAANPALEAAYWVLPKPADYNLILASALGADDYFRPVVDRTRLDAEGRWSPELSLATGLAAAGVLFWLAGRRLGGMDH